MKILQTSALAAILALGSLSANAAAYSDADSLTIQLNTAEALTVTFGDTAPVFNNLINGDELDASVTTTISMDEDRTITCGFDGANSGEVDNGHDDYAFTILNGSSQIVTTITLALDSCDSSATETTISSTPIANTVPNGTYNADAITLTVAYVVDTAVSSYS